VNQGLKMLPQGSVVALKSIEQIRDCIVANCPVGQSGKTRCGGLPKTTEQVVGIEIKCGLHSQILTSRSKGGVTSVNS